MIALSFLGAAFAATVYINGVRADVLPEVTLANATVRIDAQGNVWIDAPGYRVSVVQPQAAQPYTGQGYAAYGGTSTTPAPSTTYGSTSPTYPTTSQPAYGSTQPQPTYGTTATTPTYGSAPSTYAATPSYAPPAPATGVPVGQWWLVTEDNASTGHTIELVVNGTFVRRIVSGEPQLILDLAPFLRPGPNTIVLNALAGPQPGGGVFNVYVGKGSNLSGTIRIDNPEIRFARRSTDNASGTTKQYTLTVN
ncbi:MAG: hypothetical protein ACOZNI_13695 [Myxococcota bacterium]